MKRAIRRILKRESGPVQSGHALEVANVLVGPVIGKVTSTSARVLVEVDQSCRLSLALVLRESPASVAQRRRQRTQLNSRRYSSARNQEQSSYKKLVRDSSNAAARLEKQATARRPCVFEFRGLQPGARYAVVVEGCASIESSFCTFEEQSWDSLSVGVVSCNKVFVTKQEIPPRSDLWSDLASRIDAGSIDLLLHLGDQIYGDGDKIIDQELGAAKADEWSDRFKSCEALLKDSKLWQKREQEIVCEKYREVYRETWSHAATARCLANCPSLMIYDDHEIRDNWADLEGDWDPDTLHFFIAKCAWIVYLEYQRQLYEDVNFSSLSKIRSDYHFHVVGGLGLMFLDMRGSRSFHRVKDDANPYLGSTQWAEIDTSLQTRGLFSEVRLLLVCSPAPLVFLEPHITNAAGKNVPRLVDFRGHWTADSHLKEQTRMIECLERWKSAGSRRREVVVLGGDVHCGGHSHIIKDHQIVFNQLTTSAIANRPLPKPAYYFMRAAGRLKQLHGDYSFRHHHWTRSRNYGILQIRNYRQQDPAEVEVESSLVIGKSVGVLTGKRIKNTYISKVKFGCFEADA